MTNKNKYLEELSKKLSVEKFRDELVQFTNMARSKQVRNDFNDEMVRKTWKYQKKYGFETSPVKSQEFWNNEADAFKHTFGSADMYFDMSNAGSIIGGIYHENETHKNPYYEWNMDSWNNAQGREIAKEIEKEYGKDFYSLPQQTKDDITAGKVMGRMRSGQLITNPNDTRKYNGWLEKRARNFKQLQEGKSTGHAANFNSADHIFTREEIGKMTSDEFAQNESSIMKQLRKGQIVSQTKNFDYSDFKNPETGTNKIYTREDISSMSTDEYSKNEKEILSQMNSIGIPYKNDLLLNKNKILNQYTNLQNIGKSLYRYNALNENNLESDSEKADIENTLLKCGISYNKYVWHSENGEHTCEVCKSLDGKVFDFYDEVPERPHPNCRCTVEVVEEDVVEDNEDTIESKSRAPQSEPKSPQTQKWIMPCRGPITSGYGKRVSPVPGASTYHNGWDIGVPVGTPINTIADGKVIAVGPAKGYGKWVVIDHDIINGTRVTSEYGHLSSWNVSYGQIVKQGQVIAKSGNTGYSSGPHLHITIREGAFPGKAQDPGKYIKF